MSDREAPRAAPSPGPEGPGAPGPDRDDSEKDTETAVPRDRLDAALRRGSDPPASVRELTADSETSLLLANEAGERATERERLERRVADLKIQIEALRSDFSTQEGELRAELETYRRLLDQSAIEAKGLAGELAALRQDNKQLKTQNLSLQYHLNLWGIPVASGTDATEAKLAASAFFPRLTPLREGGDPIQVVLRGDLTTFYFPDLIHFLGNSNLRGVLTVVAEGIVIKLYLEKGVLRLASWNNRDEDLSLATLFRVSRLAVEEALAPYRERTLFDLELAKALLDDGVLPANRIQAGLKEHARVILSFLFELQRGAFFFQPGTIGELEQIQFRLPVIDVLLLTAAEVDEKTREHTFTT